MKTISTRNQPWADKNFICLIVLLILHQLTGAQPRRDHFIETNSTVNTIVREGNTVYMGGSFTQAGYKTGSAALVTGTNDFPDGGFPRTNGAINTSVTDGSGGWYIGGTFTAIGNVTINRLAHILPDRTVDVNFLPDPNSTVSIILLSGTTLYVGGTFTNIGGSAINRLAAVNSVTGIASAFNPNPDNQVNTLWLNGNELYVGGNFASIGGKPVSYYAKLDATTGAVLPSISYNSYVYAIDGHGPDIYTGGSYTLGGFNTGKAAYYTGSNDVPEFDFPRTNGSVYAAVDDGAGGWYIGGSFTVVGGLTRNRIAHILSNYTVDPAFDPNANSTVFSLYKAGNLLYTGGSFTNIAGNNVNRLVAIDLSGGGITSWNPNPDGVVSSIAVIGSEVYAGGQFTIIGGVNQPYFARLNNTTGAK